MTAAVRASELSKRYGETVALDGVSLSVASGEVFALVGPNGAGKTTLVRTLTGTVEPTDGEGTVLGQPPRDVDPSAIGLLPQSFDPPERLTVRELVTAYAGLYDHSRSVETVIEDVGLTGAAETRYEALSGGQKRRTCVGIALANEPELLFLDEPTTGIDPAGRQALWNLLEGLSADGTTVVLTTHDMAEAARLADRVGLLEDGHLVAAGAPSSLVDEYGGDPVLSVETASPVSAADFETLPGTVRNHSSGIRIEGVAPAEIGTVIETLRDRGISVEGVSWSEPTLEDAYLTMTGTESTAASEGAEVGER
jgi:ABC-2 type transport system ATP-binding protein